MAGSTFASRSYRDAAVVLRTQQLGEADRIITLLTRGNGLVRAVAKGVRRTSSKFGATLEPFMVADVQLVHGRSLDVITQAVSRGTYGSQIVADYDKYRAAAIMAEAAERLTDADADGTAAQFALLHGALSALARSVHPPDLVLHSHLLRAMGLAGWGISWEACASCGRPGPQESFHPAWGGPLCGDCRAPGALSTSRAAVELLAALQAGDWEGTRAADATSRHDAGEVVVAHLQHHLERRLVSLG